MWKLLNQNYIRIYYLIIKAVDRCFKKVLRITSINILINYRNNSHLEDFKTYYHISAAVCAWGSHARRHKCTTYNVCAS